MCWRRPKGGGTKDPANWGDGLGVGQPGCGQVHLARTRSVFACKTPLHPRFDAAQPAPQKTPEELELEELQAELAA